MKDVFEEDGVEYEYHHCPKCKEDLLDMAQLHDAAEQYRALKKAKETKLKMWGNSLAVRIPKQFAEELKMIANQKCLILKEKNALKIMVA